MLLLLIKEHKEYIKFLAKIQDLGSLFLILQEESRLLAITINFKEMLHFYLFYF